MNAVVGKSFSPLLDSILYGGSSVSMNLALLSQDVALETRLFASHALNGAMLFKYPNFPDRMPTGGLFDGGDMDDFRPIETGIYIPNDVRRPREGGSSICGKRTATCCCKITWASGPKAATNGCAATWTCC